MASYMLRMRTQGPRKFDCVPQALGQGEIIIGWAMAPQLLEPRYATQQHFTKVLLEVYGYNGNIRRAAPGAGSLWLFLREMRPGDLVLIPDGDDLYLAQVASDPYHLPEKIAEDTAFRRKAQFLNNGHAVPRSSASARLQARLRNLRTCLNITDLQDDVEALLNCEAAPGRVKAPKQVAPRVELQSTSFSNIDDQLRQIERLAELRDRGALSQEEFDALKHRIIGGEA